ncbi:C-type lectin 37Db-like [Drosophila obscura]|uniref:C-type lectin 37Db-like n=1 Tax=Drosophila obscura TaxID=7282 RepID=UPI001BB15660|nr:C-type lectin 37Db-like [Drosophila obscura]
MKPILDHIAANQQWWNAFDATKLECKARLNRMVKQLENFEVENFVQIGSRFFYIEQHHRVNWFSATSICRRMGGYLSSPRSEKELNGIKEKLTPGRRYWLGISDSAKEGFFLSQDTGNMAYFLKWYGGQPDNKDDNEHCVELRSEYDFLMNDAECTINSYFICEASDEQMD